MLLLQLFMGKAGDLRPCTQITVVNGQIVDSVSITMIHGDVNGDKTVNIGDVTLVANYFGMAAADIPLADRSVDLNNDGIVNIQDLAIVGANYNMARCQ